MTDGIVNFNKEQLATPRNDTVSKGVELALFKMRAVPVARLLAGNTISVMGVSGPLEKPEP